MDQPYKLERHDWDDGSISYEIWDIRQSTYRRICSIYEDESEDGDDPAQRGQARKDAKMIVAALNSFHNGGKNV